MTKEEAIEYLHKLFMQADITDAYGDMDDTEPYETAIEMAIEALQAQATLDDVSNAYENGYQQGKFEATQKTGKWIGNEFGECSVCGHKGCASDIWDRCEKYYCPNCGARMEVQDDNN